GPVDQGHPNFRSDLPRGRLALYVVDPRRFDAAPDILAALGPASEPIDSLRHIPELSGDLGFLVAGRVDVERDDVTALDVLGVIPRWFRPPPAAVPAVPRHSLAEVQQHRAIGIGLADPAVRLHDPGGGDRRAVALPRPEGLGVVGLVAV